MRKLATLAAAVALAAAGLFTAPAAQAAAPQPAAAAVPLSLPQMVWYDDHQGSPIRLTHRASDEINRTSVADCSSRGTVKYLSLLDASRISALLFWSPFSTQCNYLWVENAAGKTWGACVGALNWGYDFGSDFNDTTVLVGVKYSSACPPWSKN